MSLEKKKLRIALCYRGRAAGYSKGNEVRALEGQWATIQKYIIQHHDADVFLHCWSPEVKDQLLETYKPVKYIIEDELSSIADIGMGWRILILTKILLR